MEVRAEFVHERLDPVLSAVLLDQLAELKRRAFETFGSAHGGFEIFDGGRVEAILQNDVDDVYPLTRGHKLGDYVC